MSGCTWASTKLSVSAVLGALCLMLVILTYTGSIGNNTYLRLPQEFMYSFQNVIRTSFTLSETRVNYTSSVLVLPRHGERDVYQKLLDDTWLPGILNESYPYQDFYNSIRDYIETEKTFPFHMVDNKSLFFFMRDLTNHEKAATEGVSKIIYNLFNHNFKERVE